MVLHTVARGSSHGAWREFPGENWTVLGPAEWALLLPRCSAASAHERSDFLHGEPAVLVGVHCLENPLMRRLKLLQRDGSITVAVHHGKEHPHHHAAMRPSVPHPTFSAHHAHPTTPARTLPPARSGAPARPVAPTRPVAPARPVTPTRPVAPTHPAIVVVIVFSDAAAPLARLELALLLPLRLNLRLLLKNLGLLRRLLLENLRRRRLLCRRRLLRARSDDASHQNERRGREHLNLRLHVRTPSETWSTKHNSAGAILILHFGRRMRQVTLAAIG